MQLSHAWLRFSILPGGEKTSVYFHLLMPPAGIKPGPPAQQGTALSITPLYLGTKLLNCQNTPSLKMGSSQLEPGSRAILEKQTFDEQH